MRVASGAGLCCEAGSLRHRYAEPQLLRIAQGWRLFLSSRLNFQNITKDAAAKMMPEAVDHHVWSESEMKIDKA